MVLSRGSATKGTRSFIPIVFSRMVLDILDKSTVAVDCVSKDYEGEFSEGDLVTIRDFGATSIAVGDHTVDSTITYGLTAEQSQDMLIDQLKYTAFRLDYVDTKQSDLDLMEGNKERAAIALRDTIDSFLLSTMAAGAPALNTIGATTVGSVITLDASNIFAFFNDMYTLLEESNATSLGGTPFAIVPPAVMGVIRKSDQLVHATASGDAVVRNGFQGNFAQFMVKQSTNVPYNAAGTGTEPYWNILFGYKKATQFAMQINVLEDLKLQTTFADASRMLAVYGSKVTLPNALGRAIVKV